MSAEGRGEYKTSFFEECRSKIERFLITLLIFRNYVFDFVRIIKNLPKDTKKYNLSSSSILYNTLIKYPLFGFQPSAFFMYRLYENSYINYLTFFEETNCVAKMNKHQPYLLDNKLKFKHHLRDRIRTPKLIAFSDIQHKKIVYVSEPSSVKVVIKPITGMGGIGIRIVSSKNLAEALQQYPASCIVEEFIEQHDTLNAIFSESVNTVRVLTLKENEEIIILSMILRVGRTTTQYVDNISKGGICIEIEKDSGTLGNGYTFYEYGHCEYTTHPDTNYKFYGKKIPYIQEAKNLAITSHHFFPMFTIIGWDIAITETGPILIEGNRIPDLSLHQIFTPLKKQLFSIL
jgi:hypothetical protein